MPTPARSSRWQSSSVADAVADERLAEWHRLLAAAARLQGDVTRARAEAEQASELLGDLGAEFAGRQDNRTAWAGVDPDEPSSAAHPAAQRAEGGEAGSAGRSLLRPVVHRLLPGRHDGALPPWHAGRQPGGAGGAILGGGSGAELSHVRGWACWHERPLAPLPREGLADRRGGELAAGPGRGPAQPYGLPGRRRCLVGDVSRSGLNRGRNTSRSARQGVSAASSGSRPLPGVTVWTSIGRHSW